MICKCPVCKKTFDVLWTNKWAYKRGNSFLCSYGCMIRMDKGDTKMEKFTKEQKQECIRIALEGGDPKAYLKSLGSTAPDKLWYYMKTQLLKKDPETYEKLAGGRKRADNVEPMKPGQKIPQPDKVIYPKARETVETPEGGWTPAVQVYGAVNIETPEKAKVETPGSCVKGPVTPEELMEFGKDGWKELPKVTDGKKNFGLPAYIEGFEITGLLGQFGTYRASHEHNYFEFDPFGGDLCMNPQDWREQLEELHHAAKLLGVEL